MRILAIAALAGTILAGAVSTSQAAVIPVALLGGTGGATYTHTPVSGNSSFTDAFTFTLSSPSIVTFSMETSFTGGKPTPSITGATFGLYKGMPSVLGGIGTASLVAAITTTGGNHSRTGSDLTGTPLSAGSYFFELATMTTGGGAGTSSLSSSVNVGVSAVPIPATLPMFGAALLGLGAAGFVMRRRNAAPSFA